MSLINQMLRDLETRRANERHARGGLFEGLTSTAGRRRRRPLIHAAISGALILALGAVFVVWYRDRGASPETIPPSVAQMAPAAPLSVTAAPSAPPSAVVPPPPLEPAPPAAVIPEPEAAPSRMPPPVAAVNRAETEPAPMEKTLHPFTSDQRAAALYQEGHGLLRKGRGEAAEAKLREALRTEPTYYQARESLVALLLRGGRKVEAAEFLEDGITLHPEMGQFRKLTARLHLEQGQVAVAAATLEKGLETVTPDAEYLAFLGTLCQRLGEHEKSVGNYQRAVAINPAQGVWWLGMAISLEATGRPGEAATAYEQALQRGLAETTATYARKRLILLRTATGKSGTESE